MGILILHHNRNANHESRFMNGSFTLLEILIALVLFIIGIAAIAGLFGRGLTGSLDAENTTIAMNLAQRKMEEIRNIAFGNINDESKAAVNIDVDGDGGNDFSGFNIEVKVDDPAGDPAIDDLKQVRVIVYWTYKGGEVEVPLQTYISNN